MTTNMDIISYLANLSNKNKVILFISVFTVLYIYFFNKNDYTSNFFIVTLAIIGFLINSLQKADGLREREQVDNYIRDIEKTVLTHNTPEMVLETVYKLHKPLKSLRFIKDNKEATQLVFYLRFLSIYDRESYLDFIVYLEYFLKLHYNIMIEKYDVKTNFIILKDIRHELLNTLQSNHFNIPVISQTFDSGDLENRMKTAISKLQALTYRYVKIVYKKFKNQLHHETYKGFTPYDTLKNNNYHIY
jgi:hypothetical protein